MKRFLAGLILTIAAIVFFMFSLWKALNNSEYYLLIAAGIFMVASIFCLFSARVEGRVWPKILVFVIAWCGVAASGVSYLFFELMNGMGSFGAWGRPLRIRKKIAHAELAAGDQWARGPAPDCAQLDPTTRRALAELWYFDAKKEHASVPAFARLIWILTSLGASANLLEKLHYCGLQEIEHARRTLALANAYSETELSFEALPEMMNEKIGFDSNPWAKLAEENFWDGCLIEEFNADVADAAGRNASDPAASKMVRIIAKEERYHASVAWEILDLCLERDPEGVKRVLRKAIRKIPAQGTFCYSAETMALVKKSDPELLRSHGRVSPEQWQPLYEIRIEKIRARVANLIGSGPAGFASATQVISESTL